MVEGNADNCTFIGNNAKHNGGAISKGNPYRCIFDSTTADYGGALYLIFAPVSDIGCTFINNTGRVSGDDGIYISS